MPRNTWHMVNGFHWRRAELYQPSAVLVEQLRSAVRELGLAWWLEFPHVGIGSDEDLIKAVIERAARYLLVMRKQSSYRETTPHARIAQAEITVRLLAAGVQHESISWRAAAETLASSVGEGYATLPKFRAIALAMVPYPIPGTGPESAERSSARSAIGTRLMQRAVDQAVAQVTATDPDGMWLQFHHAFAQVVTNPTTDWAAMAEQEAAEVLPEEVGCVADVA